MKRTTLVVALTLCFANSVYAADGLNLLDDQELSKVNGQALLSMTVTDPEFTNAQMKAENIGFYKLGMDAVMDLNINVKSLKLGCGGVNGAGGCDIDIDNLSLSGQSNTADGRASSSAQLTNPFIEFAVKNPKSAAAREIVGFRLSADKVVGLLTTGTENSSKPNGINSLSGYMKVQSDSSGTIKGLASTAATRYNLYGSNQYGNLSVNGRLQALGLGGIAEVAFTTTAGGFNIPDINNNPFTTTAIVVNGTRMKSVTLVSRVNVPDILLGDDKSGYASEGKVNYDPTTGYPTGVTALGGKVTATVTSCNLLACLLAPTNSKFENVYMNGKITGVTADLTLNQSLGLIHNLPINSAVSLSLQKQAVKWMGTNDDDIAQKGWWLSAKDPVNIGEVIPQDLINIDQLFPQIGTAVSDYLQKNPAKTNDLGGLLKLGALTANIGNIDLSNTPLKLNVENLILKGQSFASNCYGGLKFC